MTHEGKVVPAVPKIARPAKDNIDWDTPAKLAKLTGKPVLAGENIRNSRIKSLRMRERPPFITPDGHIKIMLRDSYLDEDGVRYGNVYMQWIPNTKEGNN